MGNRNRTKCRDTFSVEDNTRHNQPVKVNKAMLLTASNFYKEYTIMKWGQHCEYNVIGSIDFEW